MKQYVVILTLLISIFYFSAAQAVEIINVGIISLHKKQKLAYDGVIERFERANPNVKVRLRKLTGAGYQELFQSLVAAHHDIDVLIWHGSKGLEELVNKGYIQTIDDVWQEAKLENIFDSAITKSVKFSGKHYGIPLFYYPWGFFYKKSLFKQFELSPPSNWKEFITLLAKLKSNQLSPIAIGTKEAWPAAAWFEYFTLRLHGYEFYQKVLQGKVSFNSAKLAQVFTYWQQLINQDYFFDGHKDISSHKSLHLIAREMSGVMLTGSFALSYLDDDNHIEFGYFPFPKLGSKHNHDEIAPTSAVALTTVTHHSVVAKRFIRYLSQAENQEVLSAALSSMSPNKRVTYKGALTALDAQHIISRAKHLSQFFDRETPAEFSLEAQRAFVEFIEHGDISRVQSNLEKHRQKHFVDALAD